MNNDEIVRAEKHLRELFEIQIKNLDRVMDIQVASLKEAVEKAHDQLNMRLQGMNEFRDALKDQSGRLATRDEMFSKCDAVEKRISLLELSRAAAEGRMTMTAMFSAAGISVVVGVIIVVVSKFLFR